MYASYHIDSNMMKNLQHLCIFSLRKVKNLMNRLKKVTLENIEHKNHLSAVTEKKMFLIFS